ncbi:MAG: universal stress protein [Thermoleophilia bacterium]|jgi:nucleotide-binding universal stress UspA family protein
MPGIILVAFDDSEESRRALERAIAEARARKAGLLVLAVFAMPLDPQAAPRDLVTWGDGAPFAGPLEPPPHIQALLDTAAARIEGAEVTAEYAWAPGPPGQLIMDIAKEREADLIVVGADHHQTMFSSQLGTNVAEDVAAHAGREVIVVQ